jgi:peptidyl-prolyl cis-trans isomerase D
MVMSLMRRHAKSWLIKFLIAIIAIVFIFYFGYSFRSRRSVKVAMVNGEPISGVEYQKTYRDLVEALRAQYKDMWNDSLIKTLDLEKQALEGLIRQKLISQAARRLGLEVTEKEIQKAVLDYPAFQINGRFDMGRYRALLSNNRMRPEDFEAGLAQKLLEGKVRQFLDAFLVVTDPELLDYYTFTHEQIKVSFVQFKPDMFKKSVQPDPTSMEAFFNEHKEDYRVPDKIKVAYLTVDPDRFKDQVKVSDLEVKDYYEYNLEMFREPEKVRARHILFKLAPDASEATEKKVREKAEKVLKEARKGKDFAALARKYSEGPSKKNGGDLGYFSKGQMVKSFEEAAFSMKKGEISDLIRTRFGYHIIKVEDIKKAETKPLKDVRDQIVKTLTKDASTELADEKGLTLLDQMPYDADLAQYGAAHGLKAETTEYFSQDEPIPGLQGSKELRDSLFSLDKGMTSDLMEWKGKFYIFQVIDKKASYIPEMKEVAGTVREDFIAYLAAKAAKAAAESYLNELAKGKEWKALAKEKSLKTEDTGFFSRRQSVPKIGYAPGLVEAAFGLDAEKPYPDTVFENDTGVFVIRWEGKEGIDEEKYKEDKKAYRFSLMQTKQRWAFQAWIEDIRKNAKIEIETPLG